MIQNIQNYILSARSSKSNITVFDFDTQACNLLTSEAIHNSINNTQETIYHKLQDGGFQTNLAPVEYKKQIELAKNGKYGFRIINAHYNSDIIKSITASLSIQNNCNSACNLYFTPKNVKALNKHTDNYDIFILQLEGSKNWIFNDFQLLLKQGEAIYIRKGQEHEAISQEDSTHLAFSIPRLTFGDIINKSLELQNLTVDVDFPQFNENIESLFNTEFIDFTKKNISKIHALYTNQIFLARNSSPFHEPLAFNPEGLFVINFPTVIRIQQKSDLVKICTSEHFFEFDKNFEIQILNDIYNLNLKSYPIDNVKRLSFLRFLYNKKLIRNLNL